MLARILTALTITVLGLTTAAWSQSQNQSQTQPASQPTAEPVSDGRPLSEWIADLKAPAPQTRNAAAYEIAGLGPAAAAAVPALIEALNDPEPSVRYPVTVALREIGPKAKAAVPALKKVYEEDINDEVASSARRAIRAISPKDTPTD